MGTCHHQVLTDFFPSNFYFSFDQLQDLPQLYLDIFVPTKFLHLPAPLNSVEYLGRKDETEDFVGLLVVVGWVCLQIHVRAHSILQFHILSTVCICNITVLFKIPSKIPHT